jgi:hypothetical protein
MGDQTLTGRSASTCGSPKSDLRLSDPSKNLVPSAEPVCLTSSSHAQLNRLLTANAVSPIFRVLTASSSVLDAQKGLGQPSRARTMRGT